MVEITFYNFTKRRNSTKRPPADLTGTTLECTLKNAVTIDSPVWLIQWDERPTWNYCVAFGQYYWITEIVSVRDKIWQISCEIDVLATAKTEIGATSAFIEYCADARNAELKKYIADGRIFPTTAYVNDFAGKSLSIYSKSGTYCLSVVASDKITSAYATGFAVTYFLTIEGMKALSQKITAPDVWESLKQYFNDPLSSIVDCYWLPVDISKVAYGGVTATTVKLGEYDTGVTASVPSFNGFWVANDAVNVDIPWHYDDFRRSDNFTQLIMYHPFIGAIPITAADWFLRDSINVNTWLDYVSGAVSVLLYDGSVLRQSVNGNVKLTLPYGKTDDRVGQMLGAGVGAAASIGAALAGNYLVAGVGAVKALASFAQPVTTQYNGSFNGSSLSASQQNIIAIYSKSFLSQTEPENIAARNGLPFAEVDTIGEHSGYIQCADASVSGAYESPIIDRINGYLNGGFYFE